MPTPSQLSNHPVDLRRIRHFLALAETLNFGRAAQRLHMAQPPLSVSIRKLENELGTRLFLRTPAGVTLTPSGEAMLPHARRLLLQAAQIAQLAQGAAAGTAGRLQIGFVGSAAWGMLQRLIPTYRARYPGVTVNLREDTAANIIQLLDGHELDVGLVRTPLLHSTQLKLQVLESDEFVVALPRDNPLARKTRLRLGDLADQSFVMHGITQGPGLRSAVMMLCQQAGFVPHVTQEATQIQTVLALVESGLGVALIPSVMQRYVSKKIAYRRLVGLREMSAIGLAVAYRGDGESPAALNFRRVAFKEYLGSVPE